MAIRDEAGAEDEEIAAGTEADVAISEEDAVEDDLSARATRSRVEFRKIDLFTVPSLSCPLPLLLNYVHSKKYDFDEKNSVLFYAL